MRCSHCMRSFPWSISGIIQCIPYVMMRGISLEWCGAMRYFRNKPANWIAQPGKMVGVVREERLHSSPLRSLSFRQSWLQINLLSSFVAAGVVGYYEDAVTQAVAVAAF